MVILFAMSNIAFADDATASGTSGSSIKSDSLYKENRLKNDKPKTFDELDLTCREIVAKTDNGVELKTQITDFDIEKGITYCQIYKKDNPDFIFSTNADAQWVLYRKSENKQLEKEKSHYKNRVYDFKHRQKHRKFIRWRHFEHLYGENRAFDG